MREQERERERESAFTPRRLINNLIGRIIAQNPLAHYTKFISRNPLFQHLIIVDLNDLGLKIFSPIEGNTSRRQ